ncbi:hypothetical protein [Novacetimonas pomaceti]|uniref:hypothetical protein n=1 Tax=Novacetimonas pomaceti TaxID=2021998 RepID=UPI00140328DB|nr:hypothetical protein [Novacetimonas pomaceti]
MAIRPHGDEARTGIGHAIVRHWDILPEITGKFLKTGSFRALPVLEMPNSPTFFK